MRQKDWAQEFPHTLKHRRATLHFKTQLPVQARLAIERLIEQRHVTKRVSAPLDYPQSSMFAKTEQLDSLKKKLRIELGNPKSNGMYDWAIEELINTIEAHGRGARVAGLVGFGYSRSSLGLLDHFFLITQWLSNHVDGLSWIRANPQAVEQFIETTFELLSSLNAKGIAHMDLWAANIMLPKEGQGVALAVDLENSFSIPTTFFSETLGFQMGHFYFHEIYRYITESNYDALVERALADYPQVNRQLFYRVYQICKHHNIGRLERRDIFLKGVLKSRW
ncbi:hypothetical protein [Pseudomonas mandelii]|uniref:hypothetical protein n=1 Tax=Pseudomonas mandelii TaxID=75612 RepID=UPI00209F16EF|nr:hypothetical protein [Pseudomonas mandelii]MCO8311624.1 hypothetical protein [Pseudomonas mandelii]